jgi:hypothetical protein
MSTNYVPLKKIPGCELFDGRLEKFGVRDHVKPDETTEKSRLLSDGRNYLWVYIDDDGFVGSFTRYAPNGAPGKILTAVANVFDTDIFSEYQPQYWGFDTEEEWHAALHELNREEADRFYTHVVKFVRGEPNDILEGTIGEIQAKIAKRLVENDPDLVLPEHRERLMKTVEGIYDRDHAVEVTLSDMDLAIAQMFAEDDMGHA